MRRYCFLIVLSLILISKQTLWGQYVDARDGIAFRLVLPNYQYPIDKDWNINEFSAGLEVEYIRHLNKILNLSFPLRFTEAKFPQDRNGTVKTSSSLSIDALLHLKYMQEPKLFYPHIYTGISGVLADLNDIQYEIPAGVGLNLRISRHFYLSTKAEYRINFDDLRDHVQFGIGVLFLVSNSGASRPAPVAADRDGDGVSDWQDLCPDQAGVVALHGCPDADGDGVVDGDDHCPNLAGPPELSGCPDSDGDGVTDPDDQCPEEVGPVSNQGCPLRDSDADGITDERDACPNEPGPITTQGCPDRDGDRIPDGDDRCPDVAGPGTVDGCPDRDGDGVVDPEDRCPDTAGPADNNGCPPIEEEDQEVLDFAMSAVEFETAQAALKVESYVVLDQILEIMNRYPDYKLRINGHTDSIGSARSNQELSERRAKAAYDYLIAQGISPERLSYRGYGESRPIADNRYKAGREKNRRVEFDLYLD